MKNSNIKLTALILFLSVSIFANAHDENNPITIGEQVEYHSVILNEDVLLDIHLPNDYSKKNKYPVLYLLDGEFFFSQAVSIVDYLSDNKYVQKSLIPKFIIVGITTKDRNKDFTPTLQIDRFPTSGKAENFLKFITEELFPYVENNYSINNKRLLTGWSLGGLFTTYCYINHSDLFDYYLAVSPSLWWDNMLMTQQLTEAISENKLSQKKYTITIGALEAGHMPKSIKESFLPVILKAVDTNYFSFIEIEDESHDFTPLLAFYKGLQSIFYKWSIPDSFLMEQNHEEMEKLIFEYALGFGFKEDTNMGAEEKAYRAVLFLVDIAKEQINYNEAITLLRYITDKHPEEVTIQFKLGEFYYRSGDLEKALFHIEKAIKNEKLRPNPNINRLKSYEEAFEETKSELENMN
ncbi:MAG: alpha/beta hydrolase-fold protein [Crocinitomicaceae bacterium]|nr:alpha/beta hydrolase-fold protein [Crocinitomicaceae bacterium]